MREAKTGSALVAGIGGATFGVVTERDYITKAAVYDEEDPHTLPVHQVTLSLALTLTLALTLILALALTLS